MNILDKLTRAHDGHDEGQPSRQVIRLSDNEFLNWSFNDGVEAGIAWALSLIKELPRLSPTHAMEQTWKPGERVELVSGGYGGNPIMLRPGTVASIERWYGYRESLVVSFDDGETRAINPDVMRHIR